MKEPMKTLSWAYYIAAQVHRNQVGKDGRPYFEHVYEVAQRVGEQYDRLSHGVYPGEREEVQVLGVLHDAVEDLDEPTTLQDSLIIGQIRDLLGPGPELFGDLEALTHDPKDDYLTEYIPKVAARGWRARLVKMCDLSHNLEAFRIPEGVSLEKYIASRERYNTAFVYLLRYDIA